MAEVAQLAELRLGETHRPYQIRLEVCVMTDWTEPPVAGSSTGGRIPLRGSGISWKSRAPLPMPIPI
jgi:hypothetical protein